MVFIQIPSQHTEEEKLLLQKYQKLKKKKKLLQQLRAPKVEKNNSNVQSQLKRESSKQDAKEVAKKLLKSGAISVIKPNEKDKRGAGFKKPKGQRKRIGADKPVGFKPFPSKGSSPTPDFNDDRYRNLYDSPNPIDVFEPEEYKDPKRRRVDFRNNSSKGFTIYVHGSGLNTDSLNNTFSAYGNILNINNQTNISCAFVTFESAEQADTAIREMDGKSLNGTLLKVSIARRQSENYNNGPSGPSSLGNSTQRSRHVDQREIVNYDDLEAFI